MVCNVPGGNSIAGANRFAVRAWADRLSMLGASASTQREMQIDYQTSTAYLRNVVPLIDEDLRPTEIRHLR